MNGKKAHVWKILFSNGILIATEHCLPSGACRLPPLILAIIIFVERVSVFSSFFLLL